MERKDAGFVGGIIVFFVLLFVFAKWGPAINFSTTTQSKGDPFVVSGEGKVYVTPDIAKVSVGIEETGSSLKTVQNSVNTKTKTLTDAIEKLGIKTEDIKTISYYVSPQYDYQISANKITGYQVSTSYEVTIRDFDKINDVIVVATDAGANTIGNINFEINDTTKNDKLNEARKIAVDNAKLKAKGLAGAAGITLGKIVNISENQNSSITPYRLQASGGGLDMAKTVAEPSVQAGQTEIDVTVNLAYEVR